MWLPPPPSAQNETIQGEIELLLVDGYFNFLQSHVGSLALSVRRDANTHLERC